MARRQKMIARSVTYSILHSQDQPKSVFSRLPAFFYAYWLNFNCVQKDLFKTLRETWRIDEEVYRDSFLAKGAQATGLCAMGDMGYSGSTFFCTADGVYLVKSIPRHFEHSFFKKDLLMPYAEYMQNNHTSLLCRITDFLECVQMSVGSLLGLAPSHHIVMENLLYGKDADASEWEEFDLKPQSYFYPERDIAGGLLTSEATKSKLADDFNGKISLSLDDAEDLELQLEKDTALLSGCNAVDYSLFLVRIPYSHAADPESNDGSGAVQPDGPPFVPPDPPSWRTGVKSADGKYIYRAAVLDFFWAKHKVHAKAMTGIINAYNAIDRKGPMSVTTDAPEYRRRFLGMVADMIEKIPNEAVQPEDPFADGSE